MTDPVLARLQTAIEQRRAVFLVGAGVSSQVTDGVPASTWLGFLDGGVTVGEELEAAGQLAPGTDWTALRSAVSTSTPQNRLGVEDEVLQALGGLSSEGVKAWLGATVGSLVPVDQAPLEAIDALGVPIMTLNYDTLIEEVTGRPSVSWDDPKTMQRIVRGEASAGVIHLHGYWSEQDSVVLGSTAYGNIAVERAARQLMTAVGITHTVVLVGFGAPLDTVQFTPLREWLSDSEHRHIRLVRDSDGQMFRGNHAEGRHIDLLSYGGAYGDLAPFLADLSAGGRPAPDDRYQRTVATLRRRGLPGVYAAATAGGFLQLVTGGWDTLLFAALFGAAFGIAWDLIEPARRRPAVYAALVVFTVAAVVAAYAVFTDEAAPEPAPAVPATT